MGLIISIGRYGGFRFRLNRRTVIVLPIGRKTTWSVRIVLGWISFIALGVDLDYEWTDGRKSE